MTYLEIPSRLKFNQNCVSNLYIELLGIIVPEEQDKDKLTRINKFLKQIEKILGQERILPKILGN